MKSKNECFLFDEFADAEVVAEREIAARLDFVADALA